MSCATGYTNILDSFLLPDGTPWTGSITYTLIFTTTVGGSTILNARQVVNISDGVDLCMVPGIYNVVYHQSGQEYPVSGQWTVPNVGGPYTISDVGSGTSTIGTQGPQGEQGIQGPVGPTGPAASFTGPVTSVSTVTSINSPIAPTQLTGAMLPKWRLALAKALNGTSDAKILCIGDSTTFGTGSTNYANLPTYFSYPARLAQMMKGVTPSQNGLVIPQPNNNNQWTKGTGWADGSFAYGFAQGNFQATAAAGNLVFTPGATYGTFDSFDVYYLTGPGLGSITITGTGGGTTTVNCVGASMAIGKTTVTCASAGTGNAVTITNPSGLVYITGVESFLSTSKYVRVGNAGKGGARTDIWSNAPYNPQWGSLAHITAYAPDLTIIQLGINDAGASFSAATYQGYYTPIITTAQASGDVIIASFAPSSGSPYTTYEPLYLPVLSSLAQTYSAPYVDIWTRWQSTWQTGLMNDALHPNNFGYIDEANAFSAFLAMFGGPR